MGAHVYPEVETSLLWGAQLIRTLLPVVKFLFWQYWGLNSGLALARQAFDTI
jgi:hypothetical protein